MTASSNETSTAAVFELRHQVLIATDRALGAEAEADRLRDTLAALRTEVDRATKAERAVRKERDALAKKVVAIRNSRSWRVGHGIVGPVARLARGAKRS